MGASWAPSDRGPPSLKQEEVEAILTIQSNYCSCHCENIAMESTLVLHYPFGGSRPMTGLMGRLERVGMMSIDQVTLDANGGGKQQIIDPSS